MAVQSTDDQSELIISTVPAVTVMDQPLDQKNNMVSYMGFLWFEKERHLRWSAPETVSVSKLSKWYEVPPLLGDKKAIQRPILFEGELYLLTLSGEVSNCCFHIRQRQTSRPN